VFVVLVSIVRIFHSSNFFPLVPGYSRRSQAFFVSPPFALSRLLFGRGELDVWNSRSSPFLSTYLTSFLQRFVPFFIRYGFGSGFSGSLTPLPVNIGNVALGESFPAFIALGHGYEAPFVFSAVCLSAAPPLSRVPVSKHSDFQISPGREIFAGRTNRFFPCLLCCKPIPTRPGPPRHECWYVLRLFWFRL